MFSKGVCVFCLEKHVLGFSGNFANMEELTFIQESWNLQHSCWNLKTSHCVDTSKRMRYGNRKGWGTGEKMQSGEYKQLTFGAKTNFGSTRKFFTLQKGLSLWLVRDSWNKISDSMSFADLQSNVVTEWGHTAPSLLSPKCLYTNAAKRFCMSIYGDRWSNLEKFFKNSYFNFGRFTLK